MSTETNRRQFLKRGAGVASFAAVLGFSPVTRALAASCGLTPAQTSGPFYPGETRFDQNTDLTRVPGRSARAAGQVVIIRGKVVDQKCLPVVGANVEIWQACASGKYNNPKDPNPAALDPNFKYWAETFTDQNGEYSFKTIIPGAYPADREWMRPPHIHFKVARLGYRELTTQMYFKGDRYNDHDLILQDLPARERSSVIVDFQPLSAGELIGNFDLTLQSVRA